MDTLADVRAYGNEIAETFSRAARRAGSIHERCLTIAGHTARFHFAGDALLSKIMPAFAHLETSAARAELNLSLFDSATTHTPLSLPASQEFSADSLVPRHPSPVTFSHEEGWLYADEAFHILWNPFFKTLIVLDAARGVGFFWTEDANAFLYHETSFPLRNLWQWWLAPRGLQLAHAAAVANERGAAVIVGASGAGKSTVALACLDSALHYLGDDFVLLRSEPEPRVFSLYNSAKLHARHWRRFPHLQNAVSNASHLDSEKALMFVHQHFADKNTAGRVSARNVPPARGRHGKNARAKISAARVLRELAVSTIFLLHGAGKSEFDALANFARQLPCYELELGADLYEIPRVIQAVLEKT